LETATAFLAGCESAIGACRVPLEFGAAGFARRTRVADLDPSPRIPVAPRGFGKRGANAACADIDDALRDHAI
jgi:hypothetical protein